MRYIIQYQLVGAWERGTVVDETALPPEAWERLLSLGAVGPAPDDAGPATDTPASPAPDAPVAVRVVEDDAEKPAPRKGK